jgi:2-desacetyl-2-hydroxyethyl bacteriochlorophyllide A dehydrogenase
MDSTEALVCIEPGTLKMERRPAPEPGPGQALVRPRRVGICGTDYHIYEGSHPYLDYPRIMGHELAVEVVETSAGGRIAAGTVCVVNPYVSCGNCVACRAGKPNCCVEISVLGVHRDGGMSGLLCLPEKNLIPGGDLTLDECACVEFLAIGAHAVRRGGVSEGDSVLVVGAGPIGLGVALFARLSGGNVTVLDVDSGRGRAVADIAGVQPSQSAAADAFDVVLDATGNRQAMENGFSHVAHGGRYVLVSVITDSIVFSDPDFHRKEMTIYGSRNATNADFERVMAAIRSRDIPVDRLITHRTGLGDAVDRIPLWAREKTGLIKAMIEIA